jgi:glycosyltransferase involved in cell wall biosynthesis
MTRFLRGGSERNIRETIAWELAAGYDVEVIVGAGSDITELSVPVKVVNQLQRSLSPRDIIALMSLRHVIRDGHFDVVHTHQSKAGILGRLACWRLPVSIWHTVHMPSFGPGYGRVQSRLFVLAERVVGRLTHVVFHVGSDLHAMYSTANVARSAQHFVLRTAIDIDRFTALRTALPVTRRVARASFGLQLDLPTVLLLGALEPRKRQYLILRELAPLVRSGALQLLIGGTGPDLGRLQSQAADLGISEEVQFAGQVDPAEALLASDLLVHAGATEGVAQVAVQALAAGIPVVATEAPGMREAPGVVVVGFDGARIRDAVEEVLAGSAFPCQLSAFEQWRPEVISAERARIYAALEKSLAHDRNRPEAKRPTVLAA